MSMAIHFSPELRDWMTRNLERGCDPDALVSSMIAQTFSPEVARALVQAFVEARRAGSAPPQNSVDFYSAPEQQPTSRLAPRTTLRTDDRAIPVLARTEQPVIAVLEGVLSGQECDELIALARTRLRPSTVVDPESGADTVAEYRDSEGMFFRLGETPLIDRLDRRLSQLMNLPVENGEGLQVLRYGPGAKTEPHFDFLVPTNAANRASIARSGQRVSTLVLYLNDVEAGGETVFPALSFSVSPRKGNALYFEYTGARGELDRNTLHAGAPVLAGEKWAATKWMRERRFVSA